MDDINNLVNFLMPSTDRPESLYKQLSKSLNRAIQQGLLAPGDALMPERELAAKLNMSRITVRKAIDQLVEIGLLNKRQGAGTIVAESVDLVLHKNLSSLNSFTADMKKRGLESYSRTILREEGKASAKEALILNLDEDEYVHAIIADDNLADKLEIKPGSAVLFVERRGKDSNGRVVEYTQSYYRGDRYDYVVELG